MSAKMSIFFKMGITVLFCIIFLFTMVKSIYAVLDINDFDGNDLGWTAVNIDENDTTHTAEATAQSGEMTISGGSTVTGEYNDGVPADDDEADWGSTYDGQYLSLYIWGNGNSSETLQIQILEEDYDQTDNTLPVQEETWSTDAAALGWTGWRYLMFKLPEGAVANDFTASGTNTDSTWNPSYAAAAVVAPLTPELRGVKSIKFIYTIPASGNANIYIDEVVISAVTTDDGWVREIFPSNDNEADSIDITLSALPPTISAVLGISADLTHANNKIIVIEEDPADSIPSVPTINLCSSNGDDDGIGGWLVTPDNAAYVAGSVYTVFIHPVNSSGEPGKCEVITFTTSSPSSTIENKYKRSLTN